MDKLRTKIKKYLNYKQQECRKMPEQESERYERIENLLFEQYQLIKSLQKNVFKVKSNLQSKNENLEKRIITLEKRNKVSKKCS